MWLRNWLKVSFLQALDRQVVKRLGSGGKGAQLRYIEALIPVIAVMRRRFVTPHLGRSCFMRDGTRRRLPVHGSTQASVEELPCELADRIPIPDKREYGRPKRTLCDLGHSIARLAVLNIPSRFKR